MRKKQIITGIFCCPGSRCLFLSGLLLISQTQNGFAQKNTDSVRMLKKVTITGEKKTNPFNSVVPVQLLNREALQQINAESIAGAAKYFSGVLIKDYGGVGGLKTISVRSLGGLNTGIVYDGVTIADAQTGQVDLSRFSSTFVQSLELIQSNPQQMPAPARLYASASILAFTSYSFNTNNFSQKKWTAGMNAGSFGLWQPYAGIYLPVNANMTVSANAQMTLSKGNYPYEIDNGQFSREVKRTNSDIRSFQGELNSVNRFKDSSQLQTKVWGYQSKRGLPGSVIFFNDIAVQRLEDQDLFVQSRYFKKITASTNLLISAKYSMAYTRYTDPDFPNNSGGLDDRYTQSESYGSIALSHRLGKFLTGSLASDLAYTFLTANINSFSNPTRISNWNNMALQFAKFNWQINASLLNTNISDKTATGPAATTKNKFTPAIAASYRPGLESPWLFRIFYKDIFRMPTFNDLYYTFISNINPKLLPEFSSQYDAGFTFSKNLKSPGSQFNFSLDAYYNSIRDKIVAVPSQNLFVWTVVNIGEVHIRGIDINAEAHGKFSTITRWSGRIAYTWQEALDVTNPSSAEYKNEIPYTPQNSGSALLAFNYKNYGAGYSLLFSGDRYALGENNAANQIPGWITQDAFLSGQFRMRDLQVTLKGEINNIFNQRYDVIRYYPMPGRSYLFSIIFNNS